MRVQNEKVNEQYKAKAKANKNRIHLEFQLVPLVWPQLRKERFPSRGKNKLMAWGDGPYKIVQKVGENAYKIKLSSDMNISITFDVGDLTPYIKDEDNREDFRVNPLQGESLIPSKSHNATSSTTLRP